MKRKRLIIYIVCALMHVHHAHASTCVKTTFNVTYSCGDGTVIGTLPDDTVAEYNRVFVSAALTSSMCAAPDGYKINGYSVYVNDVEMAFFTSVPNFTYSYIADSEIRPNYVRISDGIATPGVVAVNLAVNGTSSSSVAADYTWSAVFPYGMVNGVAKCTKIKAETNYPGYYNGGVVASDQDAIENAENSGALCYCKMTEPFVAGSPWVYLFEYSNNNTAECASRCSDQCGVNVRGIPVFRASVFMAACNI